MPREKQQSIIKYKLLYTAIILLVYLIGKKIPLYMIDVSTYVNKGVEADELLLRTISGDIYSCSIFALGISPIMISSVLVQIISSFRSAENKAKVSPNRTNRMSLLFTLMIAVIGAVIQVKELKFEAEGDMLMVAQGVAVIEMVAGVMIILWLSSRNKRYGIGGQTALVLVNVTESIKTTLQGGNKEGLLLPLALSLVVIIVTVIMENTEKRIPVQRISIHNIYADKNYLAIKLNPIGVMPAMFSTAFFMIPQLLIGASAMVWPENRYVIWCQENVTLGKPVGIGIYIFILYALSVGFSRVFINPKEITEQYLKSGDSFVDIHAGHDTRKYLSGVINRISILSATIMSACLIVPMVLVVEGYMPSTFSTLPSISMMLTGIWCNLYREYRAIRDLEAYKPFL